MSLVVHVIAPRHQTGTPTGPLLGDATTASATSLITLVIAARRQTAPHRGPVL